MGRQKLAISPMLLIHPLYDTQRQFPKGEFIWAHFGTFVSNDQHFVPTKFQMYTFHCLPSTMVEIPQDIIDSIIEAVGNDTYLLKECALVSSSFLLPSRKYIFSKLSFIGRPEQVCNWQRLYQFLVENPVIQSFVRSITIEPDCYTLYEPLNHPSLIAILRLPFCCLESFSIDNMRTRVSLNWDNFSSELKDTLSTVIHSSTLKTLHLSKINMPILLFLDINLSKLELTAFLLRDLGVEQSRLLTLAASKGGGAATASLSHTVVDHCVWNFFKPVYGTRFPTSAYFSLIFGMWKVPLCPYSCHSCAVYVS